MSVKVIGLDTAKHVFQVHGADETGRAVLKKRLKRSQVADFFGSIPRCMVGMEATRGAHCWARVIGSFGHDARLIAPQFVKPFLKGQKNDPSDAAALRGSEPSRDALRGSEVHRATRPAGATPDSQPVDRLPHAARQSDPACWQSTASFCTSPQPDSNAPAGIVFRAASAAEFLCSRTDDGSLRGALRHGRAHSWIGAADSNLFREQ